MASGEFDGCPDLTLRVGIDIDGTLADLAAAYHDVEHQLFGQGTGVESDETEIAEGERVQVMDDRTALASMRQQARRRDRVWQAIRQTDDFWLGLKPLEPGVIARLNELSLARRWEVVFVTQRPSTAGQTVQRQTQQWLMREGFEQPSVLTLAGSRGKAAAALELDVMLDDDSKNCVDVLSEPEKRCRPILVLRRPSASAAGTARDLGIGIVKTVGEALDLLETPPALTRPNVMQRILERLGVR